MGVVTLAGMLRERLQECGPAPAFVQLVDGESERAILDLATLDREARALAARMVELGARGERVLLMAPPGLEYVIGFFACQYAGAVAVPLFPPDPARPAATLPRILGTMADCTPHLVLASGDRLGRDREQVLGAGGDPRPAWLARAEVPSGMEEDWEDPGGDGAGLAFLQYTSGSTKAPRGVRISHANALANLEQIRSQYLGEGREGCSWLPPFHDMGLMFGMLLPLYGSRPMTLMSPAHFLERPVRWLRAISGRQGMFTAAPHFAYELCVERIPEAEREGLDLSGWAVAVNGAEPIRAAGLERFLEVYRRHGFRPEAMTPGYGLAEATVCVTGGGTGSPPVVLAFDRAGLERGRAVPPGAGPTTRLVGCGRGVRGQTLKVVDPVSRQPLPEGIVGEVWVLGPQVSSGYWRPGEDGPSGFAVPLAGEPSGAFLRTGDLGFLWEGQLFLVGRAKDLIIQHGRNIFPADLEDAVERAHPGLRPGYSAAFAIEGPGAAGEALVLVACRAPGQGGVPARELAAGIRETCREGSGVSPATVLLVRPGDIPRTSSGKVQRGELRARFLSGGLEAEHRSDEAPRAGVGGPVRPAASPLEALTEMVTRLFALTLKVPGLCADDDFFDRGGDSIKATELAVRVREELGLDVPVTEIFRNPTPRRYTGAVLAAEARRLPDAPGPGPAAPRPASEPDLSDMETWARSPVATARRCFAGGAEIVRLSFGGIPTYLVRHPDLMYRVLQGNARNYTRAVGIHRRMDRIIPAGLVNAEGRTWGRHRRGLMPVFQATAPDRVARAMAAFVREETAPWCPDGPARVRLYHTMRRATLRTTSSLLFGIDPEGQCDDLIQGLVAGIREAVGEPLGGDDRAPSSRLDDARCLALLEDFVARALDEGPDATADGPTVLGPLRRLARRTEARDELVTLMATGTEGASTALGWIWRDLARHPDLAARVRAEVDGRPGPVAPGAESFLAQAVSESLRLHPPVWVSSRSVVEPDRLGGMEVEAGASIIACTYFAQRHAGFWPEPERYEPARFAPGGARTTHPGAYLPFGMGARICIGEAFGWTMAQAGTAELARGFELGLEDPAEGEPEILLSMAPPGGGPLLASRRGGRARPG